ncbi:Arsenate reductase [Croceitalea dokdonensis DOKDO 023]|uniref:Arsenate reductase n=1 Tax=Croceitalea dokdonensis DOKDO 023 TaxID=1300341 RepID=A0A0P7AZR4_9FLAO|nr:arsenate reductase [Croceitalea dokdonensis]KPM32094.1 Arsenate reductase [Croceitalea dokdonensis DOKDO 023]
MGVIAKNNRKLTIYYHSGTSIGEQTLAYVQASNKKLHEVDIAKTNVTGTQWTELANGLNTNVSELINTEHPEFINTYGKESPRMQEHDWLKVLGHEPQLLKFPILIDGETYLQIKSAAQFKEYLEPDSAGIDKKPLSDQFTDKDSA